MLYRRTRQVRNRLSIALRLGAHALHHADNYLGEFFRRLKRKLGKPEAVTATAHKLARIVFHLLTTRQEYDESVFIKHEKEAAARAETRLRKQAERLGFQIIPAIQDKFLRSLKVLRAMGDRFATRLSKQITFGENVVEGNLFPH